MNPLTVVSFHAHPDDEALLTGGTLARAAAEGHRVVLVVATSGEAGLTDDGRRAGLGDRRRAELEEAAAALGVARVEVLGYPDSGLDGRRPAGCFADVDPSEPVARLAEILREERADVLTTYDSSGGYGHPDHVQVHVVAARAADLAGTSVVLEATVEREAIARAVGWLRRLSRVLPMPHLPDMDRAFLPRAELTHCVDVRRHLPAKEAALAAHASQATGAPGDVRTIALLLRLPRPLRRRALGREWFREVGREPGGPLLDDPFASYR
ncbi:MAG TPA: PIG-L family deacetylase [Nocardioides sp.]|nr:PIG-L family deacetylase [Nocardioides sp.]